MAGLSGLAVVYEDASLLVLDKPAGLLCVPGRGAKSYYKVGPGPKWSSADRDATSAFQRAQGWSGADAEATTTWPSASSARSSAPRSRSAWCSGPFGGFPSIPLATATLPAPPRSGSAPPRPEPTRIAAE